MKMRDEFGPSYSAGVGSYTPPAPRPQPKAPAEELYVSDEYKIFIVVNAGDRDPRGFDPVAIRPFHQLPPDGVGKMRLIAKPCQDGKCADIEIFPDEQNLVFVDQNGVTVALFPIIDLDPDVRERLMRDAADRQDPLATSLWKKYLDAAENAVPQVTTGSALTFRKPITLKRTP